MTVTLETLHQDTIDAVEAWRNEPMSENLRYKIEALKAIRRAEAIFDIARDYGLEAAMLYKLSDGAIDPRVQL